MESKSEHPKQSDNSPKKQEKPVAGKLQQTENHGRASSSQKSSVRKRSKSKERRRSRSRDRDRRRSRSRIRRSRSRDRRRSRERDSSKSKTNSSRNVRAAVRRDSSPGIDNKDSLIGRRPLVEQFDARNYIDESKYKQLLESTNWKETFGIVPTLDDYKRFRTIIGEMSLEYINPFRGLYGRDPSLEDYVIFIDRRQSRDWINICGRNPSFEDYVIFSGHKGLPSWEGVIRVFGREPYFQEFMQYAALRFAKKWEAMGLRVPSFEDFMCYMIEIQSINWNTQLGKVPGFTDYVVYLDKMSSAEWRSLSNGVPDFLSYMAFKEGLPPPRERKKSSERTRSPEQRRSRNSRSRSRDPKSRHSKNGMDRVRSPERRRSVSKDPKVQSSSREVSAKVKGRQQNRSRSRSSSRSTCTVKHTHTTKSLTKERVFLESPKPRYGSRSPDRVNIKSAPVTVQKPTEGRKAEAIDILAFFKASTSKKTEPEADLADMAVLSSANKGELASRGQPIQRSLPLATGLTQQSATGRFLSISPQTVNSSHTAIVQQQLVSGRFVPLPSVVSSSAAAVMVQQQPTSERSHLEKQLESFLTSISSQPPRVPDAQPHWFANSNTIMTSQAATPVPPVAVAHSLVHTQAPVAVTGVLPPAYPITPSSVPPAVARPPLNSALILAQLQSMNKPEPVSNSCTTEQRRDRSPSPDRRRSAYDTHTDRRQYRSPSPVRHCAGYDSHSDQRRSADSLIPGLEVPFESTIQENVMSHDRKSQDYMPPDFRSRDYDDIDYEPARNKPEWDRNTDRSRAPEHQREMKSSSSAVNQAFETSAAQESQDDLNVGLVEKLLANENKVINPTDNTLNSILKSIGLDLNRLKEVVKTKQAPKKLTQEEELKQMGIHQNASFLNSASGGIPGLDADSFAKDLKREGMAREGQRERRTRESEKDRVHDRGQVQSSSTKQAAPIRGLAYLQASYDDDDTGSDVRSSSSKRHRRDEDRSRRYEDSRGGHMTDPSRERDYDRGDQRRSSEREGGRGDYHRVTSRESSSSGSRYPDVSSNGRDNKHANRKDRHFKMPDETSDLYSDRSIKRDSWALSDRNKSKSTLDESSKWSGARDLQTSSRSKLSAKSLAPQIALPVVRDNTVKAAFAVEDDSDEFEVEDNTTEIKIPEQMKPKLALGKISIQLEATKKKNSKQSEAMKALVRKKKEEEAAKLKKQKEAEEEAKRKAGQVACPHCDKVLGNKQHLKRHKFDMHTLKTEVYRCYICGYDALQDRWLTFHLKYKHDIENISVPIESTKVLVPPFMIMPYCDVCKYGTFVEGVMKRHKCETLPRYQRGMLVTENFIPQSAPSDEPSPNPSRDDTHALSVEKLQNKKKELLDKLAADKLPVMQAKEEEVDDGRPACSKCLKKFNSEIEVQRHDREVHEFKRTVYRCFDCGFDAVRFPNVQKHMLKLHDKDDVLPEDSRIPVDAYQTIPVCVLCKYSTLIQGGMTKHSCKNLPCYNAKLMEELSRTNTKNILFVMALKRPLPDAMKVKKKPTDMFSNETHKPRKRSPSPKIVHRRSPSPKRYRDDSYKSTAVQPHFLKKLQTKPFESKVRATKTNDYTTLQVDSKHYAAAMAEILPPSSPPPVYPEAFKPHVEVVHKKVSKLKTKYFRCQRCNHDEQNYPRLRQHIENKHSDYGEIQYEDHLQLHKGYDSIHKCTSCSYSSIDLKNIETHICPSRTVAPIDDIEDDDEQRHYVEQKLAGNNESRRRASRFEDNRGGKDGDMRSDSQQSRDDVLSLESISDSESDFSDGDEDGTILKDVTVCPHCNEKLGSKQARKDHEYDTHEVKVKVFRCTICAHDALRYTALQLHYRLKHIGKVVKKKDTVCYVEPFTTIPSCLACKYASLDNDNVVMHQCLKDRLSHNEGKGAAGDVDDETSGSGNGKDMRVVDGKNYKMVETQSFVFRCNYCKKDDITFKKHKQHLHLRHQGKKRPERDDVTHKLTCPTFMKCCKTCDFSSLDDDFFDAHNCENVYDDKSTKEGTNSAMSMEYADIIPQQSHSPDVPVSTNVYSMAGNRPPFMSAAGIPPRFMRPPPPRYFVPPPRPGMGPPMRMMPGPPPVFMTHRPPPPMLRPDTMLFPVSQPQILVGGGQDVDLRTAQERAIHVMRMQGPGQPRFGPM